ncbi:alpha/beta hydrolase [Achromobacter xylosoxidans]|uniref:alpha/beta hydrolase n=1 Tax=Alcaligenes xylosoxydans xylosoxydans TaxID=85698 RepID=UPI00203D2DEC|nr:alpha/beta hydrolase [Achromobacter xylosoxidans]MCM2572378.1 alpha/beta hydrolase [Achromobacter xylosoxidans]
MVDGAVDPELAAFLELAAASGGPPMHQAGPVLARLGYDAATEVIDGPGAQLAQVRDLDIACRDGARIGARLYHDHAEAPLPVLLFFHGGGYVVGGLDSHDSLCRDLASQAGCAVLAVDYRLAPEHRFPTAFNDAVDAWRWLQAQGPALGLDTRRVAVGGDSVGGTLATTVCIQARDDGDPAAVTQLLLYPCTSPGDDSPSRRRYASGFLLEADTLAWMYANYLGDTGSARDWRFAPLTHPDLGNLPPAHVALAEHDLLIDEGQAYAQRLQAAGVPTEVRIHAGMTHDFARFGNIVAHTARLRQELAAHLRRSFGDAPPA